MAATMKISFLHDHINVESRGEKSIDWARELWTAIVKECQAKGCFKVLGISESSNVLPIQNGFDLVELFRELGIDTKYRIAWLELNPDAVKTVRFIDAALFNRLLPGRVFQTEDEARKWLFSDRGY